MYVMDKLNAKSFERKRRIMSIVEGLNKIRKKGRDIDDKKFATQISIQYFISERQAKEYLGQAKIIAKCK